jgi:hypothetical protein
VLRFEPFVVIEPAQCAQILLFFRAHAQVLNVSYNKLQALPEELFECVALKKLDVSSS